jgi:filamentous hemagglutinin family protein
VIDWRSFDIGASETTQFIQPSSSSVTLNRVNSNSASMIDGRLIANGNIFIVNQNGVVFGNNAKVDVNGLVATTADIDNTNFMNGDFRFDRTSSNPNGTIVNNGEITAGEAGLVGLVAPNVINNGRITARLGRVQLSSGDRATVDLYGDGLIEVAADDATSTRLVQNTGRISAEGGTIAITAAAGAHMVNSLIRVSGELRAPAVGVRNGKIIIAAEGSNALKGNKASDKGNKTGTSTVIVQDAIIDVSGRKAGERGGSIEITGDHVALLSGTVIDASGDTGLSDTTINGNLSDIRSGSAGGDIRIGGDYLGLGITPTAKNLYVDKDVLVLNDSITSGDAGRTIFWSDDTTQFYGNVYARALGGLPVDPLTWHATLNPVITSNGQRRGNGGFVETSGHKHLDVGGYVDLTASDGDRGTYFLDPTDITVYGNVDPSFISTDTTINLASSLRLWLDASDTSNVNLTYNAMGTTATGTSGTNTITVSANTGLTIGARIRLGAAGAVTAASTVGADTYTISNISGTTVTLSSNLTANYTTSNIFQGYVSQLTDKSGQANNATQATAASMPLWISNGQKQNRRLLLCHSREVGLTPIVWTSMSAPLYKM